MFSIKANKDSPQKERYLKTMNDEVLTKAQLALIAINEYERRRSRVIIPTSSFVLEDQSLEIDGRSAIHITLRENEPHNVCMIGESVEYYRLTCKEKLFPIKIDFKQVKNVFKVMCSFKHQFPGEDSHQYIFRIDRSCRKSIVPLPQHRNVDYFYICVAPAAKIGIMTVVASFFNQVSKEEPEKPSSIRIRKKETTSRSQTVVQRSNFRFFDETSQKKKLRETLKTEGRHTKSTNFIAKHKNQVVNFKQLTYSRNFIKSQIMEDRFRETQTRRSEFWLHKEKDREFKETARRQKRVISMKEQKIQKQMYQKSILTKDIAAFLYLYKFLHRVDDTRNTYCDTIRHAVQINMYQNKFCRSIKTSIDRIKKMMSSKRHRDTSYGFLAYVLTANVHQPTSTKRASQVFITMLDKIIPSMRVNESFDRATVFRRTLRQIQKIWKIKYHFRLNLLKLCGQRHLQVLLDQHPRFLNVRVEFVNGNHLHLLCLEYIKETTLKYNELYRSYVKRLDELDEQMRINEEVKKYNRMVGPKLQKPELKIPPPPKQPYSRYFRDCDILKGMIRNWFELETRKFQKRNRVY